MTVMYAFYLVLLKKYVFLRGFSSDFQKHSDGPLYFAVVIIANLFHWEIEQPYISSSSSPASTSSTSPMQTSEKNLNVLFPQSETQGCHPEIELEYVTETEEEEKEKDAELKEKGELIPIGICHRWAATPVGLVFLMNLIGTLIVGWLSAIFQILSFVLIHVTNKKYLKTLPSLCLPLT